MSRNGSQTTERRTFDNGALALDVVDRHPFGILVQDREHRLLAYNRAADQMLDGVVALRHGDDVGCQVLGCHRAGGPLEGMCVHDRARDHAGALPELRLDIPQGAGIQPVWAAVVALAPDRELVVTELRPDRRSERRWNDEPAWRSGPQLRVFVLGRTRVLSADRALEGRWLPNRAGQILKFLVTERHRGVYSDEIVARLWPNATTGDTRGLRFFIHALREHLEPQGAPNPPSSFVLATRGGYALDRTRVWVDADAFEELIDAGLGAHKRGEERTALDLLRRGMDLYRGDFLADEPYAEWAFRERDRLHQIASTGLRLMAGFEEAEEDFAAAAVTLSRLADLEPFDVDVHRDLLAMLLRHGRRSEAMRRYETLRRRMLNTFGESLDFTLADLGAAIDGTGGGAAHSGSGRR
jgi:DNA-binding SARP family transcriptional activator